MPELITTFLDVGQGDSTIALLPDNGAVLVDCPAGSAPIVLDYLERAQVTTLELVVVTHSDIDHAGGIIDVIRAFQGRTEAIAMLLDRVLTADPSADSKYRVMLQELAQLWRAGIVPCEPYAGNVFQYGNVAVHVLHPTKADHADALARNIRNDGSIVLRIEYQGARILLAADIQRQGWEWMQERDTDLKADVFKFPHHGAWYHGEPSPGQVLDMVDPATVVVSVGSTNGYQHPSTDTLNLLKARAAQTKFVCTQATSKCHSQPHEVAAKARELLPPASRDGLSLRKDQSCPCAGNVTMSFSENAVAMSPTAIEHSFVIDLFETPQCK